ncbi:acyl carrier protein [Solidesulfovibrio sp.]
MEDKVKMIFAQIMELPVESVSIDSSPDNVEEWDSLKHMNLILALEQNFGITFDEEQIVEMMSVEIIIATINEMSKV